MTARSRDTKSKLTGWKDSAVLRGVQLPSGFKVDVRQLNLETHLTYGKTPDVLRVVALADVRVKLGNQDLSPEDRAAAIQEHIDYQKPLLVEMLVDPVITEDDLSDLPEQDIEWLIAFSNRAVTEDAAGRTLGVEPLSRWKTFRDEHSCPDDCPACRRLVDAFSTSLL